MMTARSVTVSAPARIHCGLLSVGSDLETNFGGCGLMVSEPRTELRLSENDRFEIVAGDPTWIVRLARRWQSAFGLAAGDFWRNDVESWPIEIEVLASPPRHVGLGSGTQMALAVATGLGILAELAPISPVELGLGMQRGKRSAIGCYGFFEGGFIVDRGLDHQTPIAPLDLRLEFPADWPVVFVLPDLPPGICGAQELVAFERQLSSNRQTREEMREILHQEIVPALVEQNYMRFATALTEFNFRSGLYYVQVQSGAYHSSAVAQLVNRVRDWGFPAIVQSSWGPALAIIAPDANAAHQLCTQLNDENSMLKQIILTRADNRGVVVEVSV